MRRSLKTLAAATLIVPAVASAEEVRVLSIETNREGEKEFIADIEAAFEASHPGTDVIVEYMDDESFKVKLPTLLQSPNKPDLFFSFSGGLVAEQASQGVLRDITEYAESTGCAAQHSDGGKAAYSVDGKLYGLPMYASNVALWYNKRLADEAGIDPTQIKTWDDFLDQVEAAKSAGQTPIIIGAKDKWPAMFYHAMLANRIVGTEGYAKAAVGEDGGYAGDTWVETGKQLERLGALEPFQAGYLDTTYDKSQTLFGDQAGIFMLMGEWLVPSQRTVATDGKGMTNEEIGVVPFPAVTGGNGDVKATFGGMNGWLVSEGASDTAVDFLCYYVGPEAQTKAGADGFYLPVSIGAAAEVADTHNKWSADRLSESSGHTVFDQSLVPSIHAVQLDVAVDLISGATTPEDGAALMEEERQFQ
ncbi:ABC transporter substrate-binding protein [Ruegeria sp. SCPT10]|uniref:ABC transporter substrate-binding protein n=1 Tax=Ruegeria sp. SCP10 TaxID=3141377 RepID=UPI00333DF427